MKKNILETAVGVIVAGTVIGMSHIGMAAGWQKPVYVPSDGESKGARVTYEYKDDSLFYVNTKLGFVNDIELRPGEVVTHIAGGDTKRWLIDKAIVGNVQHVYIKPIEAGIDTNIIINTNQRAYRLYVIVSDDYDPLISFTFPDSPTSGQRLRVPEDNPPVYGERVNRNYEIRVKKKADKALIPLEIFDDGRQTFIRISKDNKYDLPVLYSIDPWNKKNIAMVNYRVKGEYIIVDGVYPHGRLFYQQKFWIDFFNLEKKKTVKGTMPANQPERLKRTRVVYDEFDEGSEGFEAPNVSEESRKMEEARALEKERREAEALRREQEKQERIREQQLLKEQEKEERIRKQKERENQQFLLQQEKREKELLFRQQRERERLERIREQEALEEKAAREKENARRLEEERKQQILREEQMRKQQAAEREELMRQQQMTEREEADRKRKLAREEEAKAKAAAKEQRIREREERRKRTKEEQQVVDFRRQKQKEARDAYKAAEESYDEMYRHASADEGADENVAPVDKEMKEKIYREALERQQVYDTLYKDKGRNKKAGGK